MIHHNKDDYIYKIQKGEGFQNRGREFSLRKWVQYFLLQHVRTMKCMEELWEVPSVKLCEHVLLICVYLLTSKLYISTSEIIYYYILYMNKAYVNTKHTQIQTYKKEIYYVKRSSNISLLHPSRLSWRPGSTLGGQKDQIRRGARTLSWAGLGNFHENPCQAWSGKREQQFLFPLPADFLSGWLTVCCALAS